MLHEIAAYLRYFDSVQRRTLRDVRALPPGAAAWRPTAGEGEGAWGIGRLIGHMADARRYFASAYRDEGWIYPEPTLDENDQSAWVPYLEASAAEFQQRLAGTPDAWLSRKIALIDTPGSASGWRLLMMMIEHEVHHRSQIDTYAGLQGWPVPQIFDRSYESVAALQAHERARRSR